MRLPTLFITLTVLAASFVIAAHAANLTPEEASGHVGENATVCGVVASGKFADRSKGQPTFLNLDKAHPNQVFTAVIFG